MNRRGFLKAIGVGVAGLCTAKVASSAPKVVRPSRKAPTGDLEGMVERMFRENNASTAEWLNQPIHQSDPWIYNYEPKSGVDQMVSVSDYGVPIDPAEILCTSLSGEVREIIRTGPGTYLCVKTEDGDMVRMTLCNGSVKTMPLSVP